jgi:hypothetical protein
VPRDFFSVSRDDNACRVTQFVDVGSAHAEHQQIILVSHDE